MNIKRCLTLIILILALTGCAGIQQLLEDPNKEPNLSKYPIGVHLQKVGYSGGMTWADIFVRNNSGKFIQSMYLEVYPYANDTRVGMATQFINSINIGETMVFRMPIDSSGREWNKFGSSHQIHK